MSFNHRLDPDYAEGGAPVTVEYMWEFLDENGAVDTDLTQTSYGEPETLILTQAHVGMQVRATVTYYETDPTTGDILAATAGNGGTMTRTGTVDNVPDRATANIVLKTSGTNLEAEFNIMDEDGYDLDDTDDAESAVGDDRATAPVYTWEQSDNGIGGWSALAGDTVTSDTMVDLGADGGGGKYYRLVITYTDAEGSNERIVSEVVKVGALAAPTTAPTVAGSLAAGGTLTVDSGGGSVQWQTMTPNGWVDIPGATGSLALTNAHAGTTVRALVTYKTGGDTTAIVAATHTGAAGADGDTTTLEILALANNAPVSVGSHDIDVPALTEPAMGKAGITTVMDMVDVPSLFQDADGDMLTYTSTVDNAAAVSGGNYIRFDPTTGELLYITDNQEGHGSGTDGGGNVVTITITATDPDSATATSTVNIRLNSPPSGINGTTTATVDENGQAAADLITDLNVQDHNAPTHEYGQYEWEVNNDSFTVTPNTADSSQATLAVKAGQTFPAPDAGGTLTLTITATEKTSGKSVTHTVTVTITDDPNDTDDPTPPEEDPVPGLKDNETTDGSDDDEADDDDSSNTDTDQDGGLPPDPMMMINDGLLDDFILAIDDIDIA